MLLLAFTSAGFGGLVVASGGSRAYAWAWHVRVSDRHGWEATDLGGKKLRERWVFALDEPPRWHRLLSEVPRREGCLTRLEHTFLAVVCLWFSTPCSCTCRARAPQGCHRYANLNGRATTGPTRTRALSGSAAVTVLPVARRDWGGALDSATTTLFKGRVADGM